MNGVEENNRESQKPTIALPSHVANSLVSLTRVWSSFKEVKNTWHHKYEIGNKPYKRIGNAQFIRLLDYGLIFQIFQILNCHNNCIRLNETILNFLKCSFIMFQF